MVPAVLALAALAASPAFAATSATPPSAPRHVSVSASVNSVIVNFEAPTSNGGSRIIGYDVKEYGRNSVIRRCGTTRCTIRGLSHNLGYRFQVAAINEFGRGAYSAPSNVATPVAPVVASATITFDANGGVGTMASEPAPHNTSVALTQNVFTYAGHSFSAWNTAPDGSGTSFTDGQLVKFGSSATLYAQWTVVAPPTTVTVTFDANGGTGAMSPETENVNVVAALSTNSFTRTGYTFSGWNTAPDGSSRSFTDAQLVQFVTNATLYAQWVAAPVTGPFVGHVSSNWSGYVLPTTTSNTLSSGEWTVPRLNCAATPNGNSATWVGMGGVSRSDGTSAGSLLQSGTEEDCVNGAQVNSGWFELVPSNPNHEQTFSNFPVSPGDTIQAIVGYRNGQWTTDLENLNTGLSAIMVIGNSWGVYSTATGASVGGIQGDASTLTYAGAYSVEWIQEVVTNANTDALFTLPHYGSVTFFNLQTSLQAWTLGTSDAYEITDSNGAAISVPGSIVNDGFTVNYTGP